MVPVWTPWTKNSHGQIAAETSGDGEQKAELCTRGMATRREDTEPELTAEPKPLRSRHGRRGRRTAMDRI